MKGDAIAVRDDAAISLREEAQLKPRSNELSIQEIVAKVRKVKEVSKEVMKDGVHYGVIPGTDKPTLLKPGAELLGLTFMIRPKVQDDPKYVDLGNGHREYIVKCDMVHIETGAYFGTGVGSCSTMESKYRYRWKDGKRVENPDLADIYNTVLKIAKKRAVIDGTLTAVAASEVYTQDLDDTMATDRATVTAKPRAVKGHPDRPSCPLCGKSDGIIRGKEEYGGGWVCWKKKGGCGHQFQEPVADSVDKSEILATVDEMKDFWAAVRGNKNIKGLEGDKALRDKLAELDIEHHRDLKQLLIPKQHYNEMGNWAMSYGFKDEINEDDPFGS